MGEIEQFSEIVPVAGVEFAVLLEFCFAVLPGDVVVPRRHFNKGSRRHLETIDFEALAAAALDSS